MLRMCKNYSQCGPAICVCSVEEEFKTGGRTDCNHVEIERDVKPIIDL